MKFQAEHKANRQGDIKVVVICVITATFFWLMNALNQKDYSMRVNYPIRFVYDEASYIPVNSLPEEVAVNISGDGWSLLKKSWMLIKAEPIEYRITHPLRRASVNSTALTDRIIQHFPDVHVNYVVADTFDLAFERKATKVIQIRVDSAAIDLEPGYVISSIVNVTPSLITVDGPKSLVDDYPGTIVIRIPRKKVRVNFEEFLPISIRHVRGVNVSHKEAYVSFEVDQLLNPVSPASP